MSPWLLWSRSLTKPAHIETICIEDAGAGAKLCNDRLSAEGDLVPTISDFTQAVSLAGKGKHSYPTHSDILKEELAFLHDLKFRRNQENDPVKRHCLNLEVCRKNRWIKRLKAKEECTRATLALRLPTPFKKSATVGGVISALRDPVDENVVYDSPEAIEHHTFQYYSDLFADPLAEAVPSWIFNRWDWADLHYFRDVDGAFLKEVVFCMASGKTCSDDLVVAEMLQELDDDLFGVLANMFKLRLLNHVSEDSEHAWAVQSLNLVKKKMRAVMIKDFRLIAMLPVLQKIYSLMLLKLTAGKCDVLLAPPFAFRKGHQAREPIFILRQIIEKSLEWNQTVFVLDGDIRKAYDFTRHPRMVEVLQWKGVEPILISAIIREVRRAKTSVVLDSVTKTEPVGRTRSAPQGDPGMPTYFNATLHKPASIFVKICQQKEWGWRLSDGHFLGLLLFADNYWLVARSNQTLTIMLKKWLELLRLWGWDTPSDELSYGTTAPDEHFSQYFAMKLPSEEFLGTLVFQHWVVKSLLMAEIRLRSLRELGNVGGCSQNTLPFCATILRRGQRGL